MATLPHISWNFPNPSMWLSRSVGSVLLLPGTALRKAQSTPRTSPALNLAAPQSDFFLSEVTCKDVSSLWNILAVVLILSVSKTADDIPLYFFLQAEICHFSSITGCTKALKICSPYIQNSITHKVPLQPPFSHWLFLQGD